MVPRGANSVSRFDEIETLGSGGFGTVVKCRRVDDGELFAKKSLVQNDEQSIKRFQREVRLLSKLSHPSIVSVVVSHIDSPPYWYVMPLYKFSLRNKMAELAGDRKRIAKILGKILEGLVYAHKQGVIHRDLKPENFLLNDDDSVVICDFGLGRSIDALTSRATGSAAWIGTIGYMAPEQIADAAKADARSDIFSFGRILYELLTGDPPGAVQDLSKMSVGLANVVRRCTKTDPKDRFQNASELLAAFRLVASAPKKLTSSE